MKVLRLLARVLLPVAVLAGGIAIFLGLKSSRPEPKTNPVVAKPPLVETVAVSPVSEAVEIEATGTVRPARTLTVAPEVSGRVVEVHPSLVPGGVVRAGEVLLRIDDADYALRVEEAESQVAKAELEVRMESGRRAVAEKEWERLGPSDADPAGRDLALRDPHLKAARAAVRAAKTAVERAKLQLSKTVVVAPWSAWVQSESIEPGQLVGPGSPVATLVGTDHAWVEVAVPVERLAWIDVPGVTADEGARVRIVQDTGVQDAAGSEAPAWEGRVVRLLGDLDPKGRMARLQVEVADPMDLAKPVGERRLPLLGGAYVQVAIEGRRVEDAIAVPRTALRDGDRVFVVDEASKLEVRPVVVGWREKERVLLTAGLEPGERVVTSPLEAPVPGMDLRVAGETAARTP